MFDVLEKYPQILGIDLDENTGAIISGNQLDVIGKTLWSREKDTIYKLPEDSKKFYLLKNGEKYNLSKRKLIINYTM
jgi:cyanophycinase